MHIERQQNECNSNTNEWKEKELNRIEIVIPEGLQLVVLINLLSSLLEMKYSFWVLVCRFNCVGCLLFENSLNKQKRREKI